MSFLDPKLLDAVEPTAAEAGEHKLRLLAVAEGSDKNGHDYIQPRFDILEDPHSKDFTHFMHLPDETWMDEKRLNRARWLLGQFLQAFGIDPTVEVTWSELGGEEGWAVLGAGEDEQYGEQNYIRRYVVPA